MARRSASWLTGKRFRGFKSTAYETEHPVVQVHPLTGERAIILGYFVGKLLGVSSADSGHLFAMLQDHVTRLENTVRWRWSTGDVVIWDNRARQHKAIGGLRINGKAQVLDTRARSYPASMRAARQAAAVRSTGIGRASVHGYIAGTNAAQERSA